MENAVTKFMFVRTLTKEEYEAVEKKNAKEVKRITGIKGDFMLGDTVVVFTDKPVKHGLYKFRSKEGNAIYYIVQSIFTKERAFCYSIY